MASVQQIYSRLFAGETITLQFESKNQFETMRTGLCKRNAFCVALDMTTASVLATWEEKLLQGAFVLGESVRRRNQNKWKILEQPPEES